MDRADRMPVAIRTDERVNRLLKTYRYGGIEALVSKRVGKANVGALSY